MAWNACRSCSADSDSMCSTSLARNADPGWTRWPRAATTSLTGDWASQSICTSGRSGLQLLGDREVAAGVAEPDRRGDHQHLARPVQRTRSSGSAPWLGVTAVDELAEQPVDDAPAREPEAGVRHPSRATNLPPVSSANRCDLLHAAGTRSADPWIASTGQRDAGQHRLGAGLVRDAPAARPRSRSSTARSTSMRPADAVLPLLGRVRLGQQLLEEELDEVRASPAASS